MSAASPRATSRYGVIVRAGSNAKHSASASGATARAISCGRARRPSSAPKCRRPKSSAGTVAANDRHHAVAESVEQRERERDEHDAAHLRQKQQREREHRKRERADALRAQMSCRREFDHAACDLHRTEQRADQHRIGCGESRRGQKPIACAESADAMNDAPEKREREPDERRPVGRRARPRPPSPRRRGDRAVARTRGIAARCSGRQMASASRHRRRTSPRQPKPFMQPQRQRPENGAGESAEQRERGDRAPIAGAADRVQHRERRIVERERHRGTGDDPSREQRRRTLRRREQRKGDRCRRTIRRRARCAHVPASIQRPTAGEAAPETKSPAENAPNSSVSLTPRSARIAAPSTAIV